MTASADIALLERAAAFIETEARSLRESHTCDPEHNVWGDELDAREAYDDEMAIARQLRDLVARYRAMPPSHTEREERLDGATRKVKAVLADRVEKFYLTVNGQAGRPFEIFLRTDTPALIEWMHLTAWTVSKLLQGGEPMTLPAIAGELQAMHSGGHSRHVLADGSQCFSLVERIGRELADHAAKHPPGANP